MKGITLEIVSLLIVTLPIWVLGRLVILVHIKKRGKRIQLNREVYLNFFIFYLLGVTGLVLFPLNIVFDGTSQVRTGTVNFIPVIETIRMATSSSDGFMFKFSLQNIVGNFLLLLPMGFFLPLLWKRFYKLKNTVLLGLLVSFGIEMLQFIEALLGNHRRSDIDDLILNTLGLWVGYLIYTQSVKLKSLIALISDLKHNQRNARGQIQREFGGAIHHITRHSRNLPI
jgi:glycopeptide antibiotics resistance protein